MPSQKASKVIIDTNLWISFLIGKELQNLKSLLVDNKVKIVITEQLIDEVVLVSSREKLKKYFDKEKVEELISLLEIISEKITLKKIDLICRDPKDYFLLALCKESKADFLITGDKDLLDIGSFLNTEILSARKFMEKFNN